MVSEVIDPYIEQMRKYFSLGMSVQVRPPRQTSLWWLRSCKTRESTGS